MSDASTVRAGETLILGSGVQLHLIDEDVDAVGLPATAYAGPEREGKFTGERLFSTNPRLYHAIARLVARGTESFRDIADLTQTSLNTVCGVAWRERVPIESMRERIAQRGMTLALLTQEAAIELLSDEVARKKIPARDLAVIHGIAFQNAQLAAGGATARIESMDTTPPSADAYLAFIRSVRNERNVTPVETGSAAGNLGVKEGSGGSSDALVVALPAPGGEASKTENS